MNLLLRRAAFIWLALLATFSLAAPPQTINYQGYLTSAGGTPINSTVGMTFKFYDAASLGSLLHTEVKNSVAVSNGNFNVLLGSPAPIPLPFDVPYWLTVTITGDPEMSPRQPLASSPYAFRAATLDSAATLAGAQITGSITTATIPVANVVGALVGPAGPQGPQGLQGIQGPIGPAGPNNITGNLTMVDSTNSAGNIMKGLVPFIHNFGISNTFVGLNAGNLVTTGFNNAAIGTSALQSNSGGRSNTASGSGALQSNTTGDGNTASGANALLGNTIGSNNTVTGAGALARFTTFAADNNSAYGVAALSNAEGTNNTAIGFQAGNALSSGDFNLYLANLGAFVESNTTRIGSAQTRVFIAGVRSVTPAVNDALPVVIDSLGQLGTGVASGGTVTSVATGAGLSGGPITASGTIVLAATNLLPTTACAANQIPKWNGSAWACAADADTNSGGTVTSITAGTGLTGGSITTTGTIGLTATNLLPACTTNQIPKWNGAAWACAADDNTLPGGAAGQVLQGTAGAPVWTGSPSLDGNLTLVASTNSAGNIMKGSNRFIHNFGTFNTFVGLDAGNLNVTLTGADNTAIGVTALSQNTSGQSNTASGRAALQSNATGFRNTANGAFALLFNSDGSRNTASGMNALVNNVSGSNNTAVGDSALVNNTSGNNNIAIGSGAGAFLTTGDSNIALGNSGQVGESATTRIGSEQTRTFISGVSGVTPAGTGTLPVVIDTSGQLGTGVASGGTITSIATGPGLAGGPITASGTVSLAATNLLPTTACAANQIAKWSGTAWACAADGNSGGTVTSITAGTGLTGGAITTTGTIGLTTTNLLPACAATQIPKWSGSAWACAADDNALPGGADGQVLQGTAGAPLWTDSPSLNGNLTMAASTATTGNIMKGTTRFIHNAGTANTFIGAGAGNSITTGRSNTASGFGALFSNTIGITNTAVGDSALFFNTSGSGNTASGLRALLSNTSGSSNTASGGDALTNNTTGNSNIAVGDSAGSNLTTGSNNIDIGNAGVAAENNTIRIGSASQSRTFVSGINGVTPAVAGALPVTIDSAGQLGTGGATNLTLSGVLGFGTTARQMLNLYGTTYAIGVQDFTVYQRSSDHFAWYRGGTHSNAAVDPGVGGTTLMTLSNAALSTAVVGLARAQTFSSTSDRNVKEAFAAVDGARILAALVKMPLQSWKYRNEEKVRHIGPTAQDFRAAFGVGYDDKTIATVDADGVALAAIQGLNEKVGKLIAGKNAEISALKGELAELRRTVEAMMARISSAGHAANAR